MKTAVKGKQDADALRDFKSLAQGVQCEPGAEKTAMPYKLSGKSAELRAAIGPEIAMLDEAIRQPWLPVPLINSDRESSICGRIAEKLGVSRSLVMQMVYGKAIPKEFSSDPEAAGAIASIKEKHDQAREAKREWQRKTLLKALEAEIQEMRGIADEPWLKIRSLTGKDSVCSRIAKGIGADKDWVAAFVYGTKYPSWVREDAEIFRLVKSVLPMHQKAHEEQGLWRRLELDGVVDECIASIRRAEERNGAKLPHLYGGTGNLCSRIAKKIRVEAGTVEAWLLKESLPEWLADDAVLAEKFLSLKHLHERARMQQERVVGARMKFELERIISLLEEARRDRSKPLPNMTAEEGNIPSMIANSCGLSAKSVRSALYGEFELDAVRHDPKLAELFGMVMPLYARAKQARAHHAEKFGFMGTKRYSKEEMIRLLSSGMGGLWFSTSLDSERAEALVLWLDAVCSDDEKRLLLGNSGVAKKARLLNLRWE